MQRKNPSFASLPNMPIDLTSLLDVIFIFLFVVIISNAVTASKAKTEAVKANEGYEAAQSEIDEMKSHILFLEDELFEYQAEHQAVEDIHEAYGNSIIGKKVKIVVISCPYSSEDSSIRKIMVDSTDFKFEGIEFNSSNSQNAFNMLEKRLEEYIESVQSSGDTSKNHKTIVVFTVNTSEGQIQRRDKVKIDSIIEELGEKYDYVY